MRNDELEYEKETRCHKCGADLPRGKSRLARYCRVMVLCEYCAQHEWAPRPAPDYPAITNRQGERFLSYTERRKMERDAFETTEWTPEFYAEWLEMWEE